MSFLSSGAFNIFSQNTPARASEVNSNTTAFINAFNTTTTNILVGSAWQKIASTAASHALTEADGIRTLLINVNTSAGYTVTLPTASVSTHRMLTIKHIGETSGALTIDGAGSETIDGTTTVYIGGRYFDMTLHCDGTGWHITEENLHGYETQLTVTGTNWNTTRAIGIAYSDRLGNWRLKFNISGTFSVATNNVTLVVANTIFKTSAPQAVVGASNTNATGIHCTTDSGGNGNITVLAANSAAAVYVSGDVELDSKPDWWK